MNIFKLYISFNYITICLTLCMMMFFCGFGLYSQNGECILNKDANSSGTTTTTNTRGVTPFTIDRKNSRQQFLYLSSEIYNVMGPSFNGRKLTSLAFNVVSVLPTNPVAIEEYTIRIGHHTGINLPHRFNMPLPDNVEFPIYATFTNLIITQTGWFELPLDVDFDWDGTSNIIVEICKSNQETSTVNFRVSAVSFSGTDYRIRAVHTNVNTSTFVDGCSMFSTGASSQSSSSANTAVISDVNRRTRPDVKLTFACTGLPTPGNAIIESEGDYCSAEPVFLSINNGDRSSRLTYKWQYSTDNINFLDVSLLLNPQANNENIIVERGETNLYYRRLTTCPDSGLGAFSTSVEVKGINTWDGFAWSLGTPQANEPVKINSSIDLSSMSGVLEACTLFVENGVLTVNANETLIIRDKLIVSTNAEVVFNDTSSLIQGEFSTTNENIGNIKYKRKSTPMRLLDYTYWSSPVSNQLPANFSPLTPTNRIYHWNHSTQAWNNGIANSIMTPGKGYIFRAPNGFPTSGVGTVFNGEFIGIPNNGDISVPIAPKNNDSSGPVHWNLLGNPYPSSIDADAFLLANQDFLDGTIYYWTHNSTPSGIYPGEHALNYNVNDYATYNLTGSVGTGSGVVLDPNDPLFNTNNADPGKFIASGQGFMVPGGEFAGEVIFKNSMRVVGNNNVFFRNTIDANADRSRIWLEVFHENGSFKQMLVGFVNQATDGLDWGFDGRMLEGSDTNIYTIVEGQKLTIDGRGAFDINKTIPLVFQSNQSGNFYFSMYQYDGFFESQEVYLFDLYLNQVHNLKDGVYNFNSMEGVFSDRFELRFQTTLSVGQVDNNSPILHASLKNNYLKLLSLEGLLNEATLYDIQGRKVMSFTNIDNQSFETEVHLNLNTVYIIKISNVDGLTKTIKLIN